MRIFPHYQDTGGFFVAVIQKVAEMPPPPPDASHKAQSKREANKEEQEAEEGKKEESRTSAMENDGDDDTKKAESGEDVEVEEEELAEKLIVEGEDAPPPSKKKKKEPAEKKEEPFLPLSEDLNRVIVQLREFYGLKPDFPTDQLMARGTASPVIYAISKGVREVLWSDARGLVQLINTGIRLFVKHTPPGHTCPYRICQEGLGFVLPYVTKQILSVPREDFITLLKAKNPVRFDDLSPKFKEALLSQQLGCCIYVVEDHLHEETNPLALCAWRANASTQLLVNKQELNAMRSLFLDEEEPK